MFSDGEHSRIRLTYKASALKALRRMQPAKSQDLREAMTRIAADPSAANNNLTTLKGVEHGFRLRVGNWRASFILDRENDLIDVFEIAPRGGAYR